MGSENRMPLLIGRRFIVSRVSECSTAGDRLPVILAHGRAFGSGEHETTRSCIEELEEIAVGPDSRVLDLGCGTGVLSVAAARMGARFVVALDPCPDAMATTLATIRLNGMQAVMYPVQGDLSALGRTSFDLILANLYGDIILRFAEIISALLAPGGALVVSGIPYGDTYEVGIRFTWTGCGVIKTRYLEDYTVMVIRKRRHA
jgi:ribosomal protein L11 methyltransferase